MKFVSSVLHRVNCKLNKSNCCLSYSVAPNDSTLRKSIEFNGIKSKWVDSKCRDLDTFGIPAIASNPTEINFNKTALETVSTILCSGPKFTEDESDELTKVLFEMQEVFTDTKVCLPKHFDVCLNLDRIFEFTYVQDKDGHIDRMDMSQIMPRGYVCTLLAKRITVNFLNHYQN